MARFPLTMFNDLFQTGGNTEADGERVQEISLSELFPFKDHPFQVRDVDSNLQREKILPSEKAFAYKMKMEALKHQGKRRDLTCERGVHKLKSRDKIVQDAGESCGLAVTRYIALTKLIPPLLALVDEDKLSFSTAADNISHLIVQEQTNLVAVMDRLSVIPAKGQLEKIKERSKDETLTISIMESLLSAEHPVAVQVVFKQARRPWECTR